MNKETFNFQTEIKQLLDIMINSLYQNKEIFLRELISNASDAIDKLRFNALQNQKLLESDYNLKIEIELDKEKKTIKITDNGIGLSKNEIITNLGTIAKSGTKEFLQTLTNDEKKTTQLIGKFGVGFYSSFMVAKKITVESRKAGLHKQEGVKWESTGNGEFIVETIEKEKRGTIVTLHLKDNEHSLLNYWKIKKIINTYSDHISVPIIMKKENTEKEEIVNKATALWALPKNEITTKQYYEFYKHLTNDTQDPLIYSHNKVEGSLEYTTLLFIPEKIIYDTTFQEKKYGLKLYIQRIFIMDDVKQFLPNYLRFVRGIIDANNLPLNVSRETLQENSIVINLKNSLTNRVFSMLEELTTHHEKYIQFWKEFGNILKEGPAEDYKQKEKIVSFFRFSMYFNNKKFEYITLEEYIEKTLKEQEYIYFLNTTDTTCELNVENPYLEIFKKKNIPVLLLFEKIDEWVITHLTDYKGKKFKSVLKDNINMSIEDDIKNDEKSIHKLLNKIEVALESNVKNVKVSKRLITTPACVVIDEYDMSPQMEKLLQQTGKNIVKSKPILEININHKLIKKLDRETNINKIKLLSTVILKQALLIESGNIENPVTFVNDINMLILESE